ncbi:LodA/GoxA family CTQ-dependent oxidase [Aliiglaciecola sp. LCG003]|uniref:LodA/GoxA family CTQ-dependent oxidase n=1 Tax=Aliiglaciecola sp. LCG003 TaxID=3053655 RepID=UPI00257225A6|nr:LodA/GoxA family CTQ-dependent oxidase [Aliiglaciecola sp. LCG003]WJG09973.1 LodA/GoxA family CTQ-dependent oxidase [Aliiglaciecola sp. LCG003]
MTTSIFRIHPTINFSRVGTSSDYYIAPETASGELLDQESGLFGGLPIKRDTEDTPITDKDFRDTNENVLRQAARFKIFVYDSEQTTYPSEDPGKEIQIGDSVGGKIIKDIVWTVHVANKKNNNYKITSVVDGKITEEGIIAYENGGTPPIRNPSFGADLNASDRRKKLVIDPGPRTITSSTSSSVTVKFDKDTARTYADNSGQIMAVKNYPVSFPAMHFDTNTHPDLGPIDTLGELQIEKNTGRLVVTGGYGRTFSFKDAQGKSPSLVDAIDNDGWFDDVSDGPVNAVILFNDGSSAEVVGGWVVCTDPAYAPQTRNVVSTWDDMFFAWVEQLNLIPQMFDGNYKTDYQASFYSDVLPVFHGAFLQRWNTNLPNKGVKGHNWVASIKPSDDPSQKIPNFLDLIRDPNAPEDDNERTKMPLSLGDATKSFLSVTPTQYFLMTQWYAGKSTASPRALGEGENLDKVVLENCLGGRYSPGIDLTFIVRDVNLYKQNWQGQVGPFRVNQQVLNYASADSTQPFLQEGYVPLRTDGAEPGDLSKFMSQPWHTDYNSCAVHTPDPNPSANNTLYWSWPAQRPVQVHPAELCSYNQSEQTWSLGGQLFSIRGDKQGDANLTHTNLPKNEGKYQKYIDFMPNWHKTGFIIQGVQIADKFGGNYGSDKFLEVASLYKSQGNIVQPWPTADETLPNNG